MSILGFVKKAIKAKQKGNIYLMVIGVRHVNMKKKNIKLIKIYLLKLLMTVL